MTGLACGIPEAVRVDYDFGINKAYPCLSNDPGTTPRAMKAARKWLGAEQVLHIELRMVAEEFAYHSHKYQGAITIWVHRTMPKALIPM